MQPSQGFIAWGLGHSCRHRELTLPAHLLDRWPRPAGCGGVSIPINTPLLIKMWRLSTASLMQKLAVAQSGAGGACLLAQATRVPALPPRQELAAVVPDPGQNCWKTRPRKTSRGGSGRSGCAQPQGKLAPCAVTPSAPPKHDSQGTQGCAQQSPGVPAAPAAPLSLAAPQGTPTTWCLRSSGGALMSWPHT